MPDIRGFTRIRPEAIFFPLILVFLAVSPSCLCADTLFLKNGRTIEGLIISEDNEMLELEVSAGTVKFQKSEIEKVEKSAAGAAGLIREKWERQKAQSQQRFLQRQAEEGRRPKRVDFLHASSGIVVEATLNEKTQASLLLDTGASMVMLRKSIAQKMGIDLQGLKPDMQAKLADGRQINAKHIILKSIKVQGIEEENVDAAILLDEAGGMDFDGLLGMSFLKRFNFKINYQEKKLTLERL